jgi:hypothetical protein
MARALAFARAPSADWRPSPAALDGLGARLIREHEWESIQAGPGDAVVDPS